ncbi:DUF6059 family protein [Streptomyces sp. NPDC127084]|uniref:DUF6059 family protein n=1 Tax=Streptomyces sp. NPDC127084 TaxID=3347133 RepID=UPI00364695FA
MTLLRRVAHGCYDALVAAGWIWIGVPAPAPGTAHPGLRPPPPGHPERVRPDIPLTPAERRLRRQLTTRH